ncbi:MAG: hypothetical protein ABI863_05800 [Ginsengibacter sp.]
MSNENHNSTGNWRSELEALECLPGETGVDKNASWEKLHDRLREKKSGKKIIWYWSAAACLLLVLIIPLINSIEKDHGLTKAGIAQKRPGTASYPTTLVDKKDSVQITGPVPFERNQKTTVMGKRIKKYQVITPYTVAGENQLANTVSKQDFKKETTIKALQPLDTSLNITGALPVNKILKVVHINELGDPVEESPGTARSADIHSFQLKLASQEVVNSAVASRANGYSIFKSKTSPN